MSKAQSRYVSKQEKRTQMLEWAFSEGMYAHILFSDSTLSVSQITMIDAMIDLEYVCEYSMCI